MFLYNRIFTPLDKKCILYPGWKTTNLESCVEEPNTMQMYTATGFLLTFNNHEITEMNMQPLPWF